jgi:hypothetical protein
MAKILKCDCGQVLDIEGFQPAAKVRCPKCQKVLTVPPPMAVAVAIDSDSDIGAAVAGQPKPKVSLTEQRRQADRQAAYASQGKLKKVILWPCLVLGLVCLFGVSGLGVYWQWFEPKVIEITKDAEGVDHLKARVLKDNLISHKVGDTDRIYILVPEGTPPQDGEIKAAGPDGEKHRYVPASPAEQRDAYEQIEVQPDLIPGDSVTNDEDNGLVYTIGGKKVEYTKGGWKVTFTDPKDKVEKTILVTRRGLWFYELDPAGKIKSKVDLPLIAQERTSGVYVPVEVKGTSFVRRGSEDLVDVAYYKAEDQYLTNRLGKFKGEDEEESWAGQLKQKPWIFIATGVPIGLILLLAAGFFAYESYFSKAAKAAKEKAAAEKAAKENAAAAKKK